MRRSSLPLLLAAVFLSCTSVAQSQNDREDVDQVLNDLHDAASKAEGDRYFGLYTEDAIFLGTDATERWTITEFKAYANPFFDKGRGWTYHMTERNIYFSADGKTAWFDERLDNDNLGDTRGSGVLVKLGGVWKIAQYNLTVPIPNDLVDKVVQEIREMEGK